MNILSRVPLKAFTAKLKDLVKPGYTKAMWPTGGFFLIYIALTALLVYVDLSFVSTLYMNLMMLMYGMASTSGILIALLELLGVFALILALGFWFNFISTAVVFTYQDRLQHPDVVVGLARSGRISSTCVRTNCGGSASTPACSSSCGPCR